MTDTIGVAVIDDHPVFRDGTAALLGEAAGITVVGVGGTVDEARAILGSSPPPDVMLLDVRLGGDSGLRLLGEASQRCAVVIFTAYDYPQYMQAALAEGAAGFVAKSATTDELIEAVRRAAAGELAFRRPVGAAGPALTARDVEVISLVADGLSNDEIGTGAGDHLEVRRGAHQPDLREDRRPVADRAGDDGHPPRLVGAAGRDHVGRFRCSQRAPGRRASQAGPQPPSRRCFATKAAACARRSRLSFARIELT